MKLLTIPEVYERLWISWATSVSCHLDGPTKCCYNCSHNKRRLCHG